MVEAQNLQYCRWPKSHCGRHYDCDGYIYTILMYTNARSVEDE